MSKPKRRGIAAAVHEASGPPAPPLAATLQQAATNEPDNPTAGQPATRRRQEGRQGLLIYVPPRTHLELKLMAARKRTTMQALCASAIDRLVQEARQE